MGSTRNFLLARISAVEGIANAKCFPRREKRNKRLLVVQLLIFFPIVIAGLLHDVVKKALSHNPLSVISQWALLRKVQDAVQVFLLCSGESLAHFCLHVHILLDDRSWDGKKNLI